MPASIFSIFTRATSLSSSHTSFRHQQTLHNMGQRQSVGGCFPKNHHFHQPFSVFNNLVGSYFTYDCDCHLSFACPYGEPSMPPHLGEFINEPIPQGAYAECPDIRISATMTLRQSWDDDSTDIWSDWRDNNHP